MNRCPGCNRNNVVSVRVESLKPDPFGGSLYSIALNDYATACRICGIWIWSEFDAKWVKAVDSK